MEERKTQSEKLEKLQRNIPNHLRTTLSYNTSEPYNTSNTTTMLSDHSRHM